MLAQPLIALTCLIATLTSLGCAHDAPATPPDTRIIEIDKQRLTAGDLRYNVVIRDGDVIRASETPLYDPHALSPLRESDCRGSQWVLRAGDVVTACIFELESPGVDHVQTVRIEPSGAIRLYKVGPLQPAGLTRYELTDRVRDRLEADGILRDATVSILLTSGYGQFTVQGVPLAWTGPIPPGTCRLASTDTRLLAAIQQFGGLPASYTYIYILRPQPEPEFRALPGALSSQPVSACVPASQKQEQEHELAQDEAPAVLRLFFRTSDELPDHHPDAMLSVNGTGLRVGLDTGSGLPVILFDNAARLLGLELRPDESDRFRWATTTFGTDHDDTPSTPTDVRVFPTPPNNPVAGAIGWPVLKQSVWVLDYPSRRHARLGGVPATVADEWQSFPIVEVPGQVLAIEVTDGDDTHVVKIDTGSNGGVHLSETLWQTWEDAHPDAWTTLKAIYSPAVENGFLALPISYLDGYRLGNLSLGPVELSPSFVEVNINGTNEATESIILGTGVLRNRAICIDGPGGRVYFGPLVESHENDLAPEINLAQATFLPVSLDDDGPMVAHVIGGGTAHEAGLRNGDLLLEVNGMDATRWQADPRVRPSAFLKAPAGSELHLLVRRDEASIAIDIRLEPMLAGH